MDSKMLPIEPVIPALQRTLISNISAVLVAAPGAGKTTRIPLALLNEAWLAGRKIIMLEPRRLAARAAAAYMAALLGEQVGETVGYRVRMDTRVGPATRIEVITEGVLTRLLQADPALENVGIVIFDEFHERNLHADLGLALCRQTQELLREDLRILVMSATLEAEPVAVLLGDAPILRSEGRAYPVDTHYLTAKLEGRIEPVVVQSILTALNQTEGSMLVFLPGAGEIHRVAARLAELGLGDRVRVAPLYGSLSNDSQDLALAPAPPGVRKIVLATSIAETSLTVEGVRVVIDSGLMRIPRFSPRTGMTRLETVAVSKASADQRRGRAGRLGPGDCFRLWTEQEQRQLAPSSTPEIKEADLVPLALELAAWGVADPQELVWLDSPPAAALNQAKLLLAQLGALHADGSITPHGRRIAEIGMHPRLAHMILQAIPLGLGRMACDLAAILSERDFLRGDAYARNVDLRLRLDALANPSAFHVDSAICRRIGVESSYWQKALSIHSATRTDLDSSTCGLLLGFAYPDRIAGRRATGKFTLSNGRGAAITELQSLSNAAYLVAADLDDQITESRIYLAAPIELNSLYSSLNKFIDDEDIIVWDKQSQSVRARKRERLGALILKEIPHPDPDPAEVLRALIQGIEDEGLSILPWSRASRQLQERLCFMHQSDSSWPDVSVPALIAHLSEWLSPHLYGLKSLNDLQRLHLVSILEGNLSWEQRQELEQSAPTHITVPSGSRVPVDYSDPAAPALSVRLQEMFGLEDTPRIAGSKVPLTLNLLSPAQRPVQVTRDLGSFWRNAYFEVKKDLKGRYPKHYWPDDPLIAEPTNRAKPRS
ncbi:ATP-dependent helicase HrpB [Paenibacillus sp. GP183]|uniref:ATP-dependent helicase HrpB n=1 Tax=Paenibacillus sp. GP183 TaxID=1882751 RepID=UPI00089C5C78|nr:ATP-dependent helicase HrpB [Paenibacillus sp. GP183]SEB54737.1 ATP-dependent helicase HrpB [Paenibacillus sp. GP183]